MGYEAWVFERHLGGTEREAAPDGGGSLVVRTAGVHADEQEVGPCDDELAKLVPREPQPRLEPAQRRGQVAADGAVEEPGLAQHEPLDAGQRDREPLREPLHYHAGVVHAARLALAREERVERRRRRRLHALRRLLAGTGTLDDVQGADLQEAAFRSGSGPRDFISQPTRRLPGP